MAMVLPSRLFASTDLTPERLELMAWEAGGRNSSDRDPHPANLGGLRWSREMIAAYAWGVRWLETQPIPSAFRAYEASGRGA